MARSQRLRLKDVRAVYHLIQECRELGADWELWSRHLLTGWAKLLDGCVPTMGGVSHLDDARVMPLGPVLSVGWVDERGEALFREYVRTNAVVGNPAMNRFVAMGLPTAVRSMVQLIDDRTYHNSEHFNQWIRPMGIDDCVIGAHRKPGAGVSFVMTVHRPLGAAPFERRHCCLTRLLLDELIPLIGTALAAGGEPRLLSLSPRLRQTLLCLLEGDGEKQAARRLGLSTATVHQYVGQLYRHFGVNDRAELLAMFLRRSGLVARLREMDRRADM
jgi:DNA-binding CsgD family transcriptional regulator